MDHCQNCPCPLSRRPCLAVSQYHPGICRLVDPKSPFFNPVYVKEVTGGEEPYTPPPVPAAPVTPVKLDPNVPQTLPPSGRHVARRLVVARYKEDLSWLKDVPLGTQTLVYNKGDYDRSYYANLENVGRETTSFLHHIVEFYNNLADVTLFVQGSPHDHCPDDFVQRLSLPYDKTTPLTTRYAADVPYQWIKDLDRVEFHQGHEVRWGDARIDAHGDGDAMGRSWFNPAIWHHLFCCPLPDRVDFAYGASYAVVKSSILARPLDFWKWLLETCGDGRDLQSWTVPPLNPWSFESIACYLFSDPAIYPHRTDFRGAGVVQEARTEAGSIVPTMTIDQRSDGGCGCGKDRPRINRRTK